MPKRLYICEICGHHKSLTSNGKKQIVCIDCVERDLLALNDRIKRLEKRFALHENQETQSQQPLKNSQEFNKSYEAEKMPKKSAITNGEMESSPAHLETSSPVDTNHEKPEVKG